jgi:hypothetical protein
MVPPHHPGDLGFPTNAPEPVTPKPKFLAQSQTPLLLKKKSYSIGLSGICFIFPWFFKRIPLYQHPLNFSMLYITVMALKEKNKNKNA